MTDVIVTPDGGGDGVGPRALPPTVVVVGAAARDIASDDPRGWRLGGGVAYSSLTLARLGVRTAAVMGVDGLAAEAEELGMLRDAGAELHLVRLEHGPVFENVETPTGRVQTCLDPGEAVQPATLPPSWRQAAGWMLAPVANEIPDSWVEVVPGGAPVALGWQGLLRDLIAGERTRRRPPLSSRLLARADLVGVSRFDVGPATELASLRELLHPHATLVLTEGILGGLVFSVEAGGAYRVRRYPAIPADAEVDATGAGDVFLAALLATKADPTLAGRPGSGTDLRLAAAAASLVVEAPGLAGVPWRPQVAARMLKAAGVDRAGGVRGS